MGEGEHRIDDPMVKQEAVFRDEDASFYLEEMQKMNSQMIDMQRELNRALMESRRMQEELRHSDELKQALEKAEKAGRAKLEFMSRMSHDLRTPMNVIMGLAALTLDEADDPAAVREHMANIRSTSDYMLGLVNDILDMSKAEQGRLTLHLEPYSYQDFLKEIGALLKAQCSAKGITLVAKPAKTNPVVMADKLRLKQIFFNILSNAITYTPSGGTIQIGAYETHMDAAKHRISVEYRVSDSGIGMSEEFQKHLFEPFMQEDTSVSPELRGSGIGLSLTKHLIELMGGGIRIESKQGQGTTVIVELTFDLADQAASPFLPGKLTADGQMTALQGKCVLLAEDHPLNAQIARRMLEKQHMTVLYAQNGRLAVELFQASAVGSISAVLMDIRMPEMTGLEAARAIRALDRPDAKTVPIIADSANAYPEDVKASLDAGINEHLVKPIQPAALYQALIKHLA